MPSNLIFHDFYCINCGAKMTLPRKRGHQKEAGHLKKCYCYACRNTVNFFEAKNYEDAIYFQEAFANGEFAELAKESIEAGYTPTGLTDWS